MKKFIALFVPVGLFLLLVLVYCPKNAIAESTLDEYDLPVGTILPELFIPETTTRILSANTLFLDADTPATGSLLQTQPLVTPYGTIFFEGEVRDSISDPDIVSAGASGNGFDIGSDNDPCSPDEAEMIFSFDIEAVTFIYGGNAGVFDIEARDINGAVVDSFYQADTYGGMPAGPITLSGSGIRSLFWQDPGACYAVIDNVEIEVYGVKVLIDIKPGSYLNSINPRSKGKISVAILSSMDFDAPIEVDAETLTFGATGDEESLAFCNKSPKDVNSDGFDDLVCHFYTQMAEFECGDEKGILKGLTLDGTPVEGSDSVRIVPSACR